MQLGLNRLMPIPLRNRLEARASGIWQQDIGWQQGKLVFLQAPSGTGKTTLIQMLYGIRKDYAGSVKWGNTVLKDAAAFSALRERDVSIVFQDLRVFPELTAWENLEIKRTMTNNVTEADVTGWMERLGIADKKSALGRTLSYGEQQRLVIIRALLQPFKWLLMDEPFSHLDHSNTGKAAALILEIVRRNGAGMVLADLDDNDHFPYTQKILL